MKLIAFALICLLSLPALAADFSTEKITSDIADAQVTNAKLLKIWARQMKFRLNNNALRGKARVEAKAALAKLEKLQPPAVPLLFGPYHSGEWGVLFDCSIKVVQVIDEESFLGRTADSDQLVMVKGIGSTEDLTDDSIVVMKSGSSFKDHSVVKISTTRYETLTGGTNTILLIEEFDVSEYAELIWGKAVEKPKEAEKPATTETK